MSCRCSLASPGVTREPHLLQVRGMGEEGFADLLCSVVLPPPVVWFVSLLLFLCPSEQSASGGLDHALHLHVTLAGVCSGDMDNK